MVNSLSQGLISYLIVSYKILILYHIYANIPSFLKSLFQFLFCNTRCTNVPLKANILQELNILISEIRRRVIKITTSFAAI